METICVGLIFIVIAILIKVFPNLLAGFNSLSHKEKENAVTNGLTTFASIVFGVMGLLVIAGYLVGISLNQSTLSQSIMVAVSLLGSVVIIVFGNSLTKERIR